MAEFRTYDLGRVLQTAEAIKGMRREGENDRIRNLYMGEQVQAMKQNRDINAAQETRAKSDFESQANITKAKFRYLLAQTALNDPDPVAAIKQYAPDLITDFDQQHGQGAFEALQPEQRKAILQQIQQYAGAQAGIVPQQRMVTKQGPRGSILQEDPSTGELKQVVGPDNSQPNGGRPPARFRPMTAQEVQGAGLPPGTAAQVNDSTGQIQVLSKRDASATLSQKDATVVKQKLTTLNLARQQLANIQQRFNEIKDGVSAGPGGQGMLPTPGGQSFDRSVDQMRSTLSALTRVPGIGAMSDFETKLDQAKFPSRRDYEQVTQQQIDDIGMMLRTLEDGYNGLLTGGTQPTQEQAQPDLSQLSNEDLLRELNGG